MILVTGGTGLLGSHLLYSLTSKGEKVRAVKRPSSNLAPVKHVFSYYSSHYEELFKTIEWVDCDLFDVHSVQDVFEGIKTVYHCAAIVSFYPSDAYKMISENPLITGNLINEALSREGVEFCHVSSVAALGRTDKNEVLTEKSLWTDSPENSNYAKSKYLAEMEVWRGIEEGLKATIVNPCIILGPGFWQGGSGKLFSSVYSEFPYYTEGVNAFVDVRDVVDIMMQLVEKGCWGERFLTTAENKTYQELFNMMADELNVKRPHKKPSPFVMGMVWRIEWLRSLLFKSKPLITKETARSSRGKYHYSSEKVKQRLNFTFRPLSSSIKSFSEHFLRDLEK